MSLNNLNKLIPMLEKVSSLTLTNNPSLISQLEGSIKYASRLESVNIDGVEPMYHIDEGGKLFLQEDKVEPQEKNLVMSNAGERIEDYFVAPLSKSFRDKKSGTKSNENSENQI